jgi:hypothetical protein
MISLLDYIGVNLRGRMQILLRMIRQKLSYRPVQKLT